MSRLIISSLKTIATAAIFLGTVSVFCRASMVEKTKSFEELCSEHIDYLSQAIQCDKAIVKEALQSIKRREKKYLPAFRTQYHIIPELIKKYNLKRGCEVGVLFGTQSLCIVQGSNLEHLYCVDQFKSYNTRNPQLIVSPPSSSGVGDLTQTEFNLLHELVKLRFKPYQSRMTLINAQSPQAATAISDHSLDFVYLDGDHTYPGVKADLEGWFDKVRSGGFIIGDDYCRGYPNLRRAVDEFVAHKKLTMTRAGSRIYIIQKP